MTDANSAATLNSESFVEFDHDSCEASGNIWTTCGNDRVCVSRHLYGTAELDAMCKRYRERKARDAIRDAKQPRRGPTDMNL